MKNLLKALTAPPRNFNEADALAVNRAAEQVLIEDIQDLESRAHRLGMIVTGHALNNAKNAAGWECAGQIELAGMAARGERPKGRRKRSRS